MLAAPGSVLATVARTLASPRRRRPSWTPSNLTTAERVHFVSGVSQPRCLETHGIRDAGDRLFKRREAGDLSRIWPCLASVAFRACRVASVCRERYTGARIFSGRGHLDGPVDRSAGVLLDGATSRHEFVLPLGSPGLESPTRIDDHSSIA
jgi:hypothetical protein